ncbi:RNA-guided endonuclease TnpB family protein [Streptomyces scabiei]|uniref:RNA-guided endonuclease InsQ/TnpB family protein n=1 Tax=Streptomyces scabiei TaxID=1930 RepID=UPI00298F0D42|nr:RNA-guided endonuclease TnpB family protein [Streptomyces scabiei]MDW8478403.1 RNA-guided endonuclease TnpB family protein [Streptomyces scabiei]
MRQKVLRAFRFALDPTPTQVEALTRHAGAARWAFNHALGMKVAAHQQWRRDVDELVDQGVTEAQARKTVRVPVPTKPGIQKHLNQIKGDSRAGGLPDGVYGPERPCPWWHEVNTYAFQSAFIDADHAWKNWLDSLRGTRAGRRVGYPQFKKKGRAREAFRLHHDVKRPTIRLEGYRRLLLPRVGSVRLHESAKRMGRPISRGQAIVQSVTVSRAGHRWYASVLCKVTTELPERPTQRQRSRGRVGVDLGVKHLAVLSQPLEPDNAATAFVTNPRHVRKAERRLAKAQQALARTEKGSARRGKARQRVARLHHEVAVRRSTVLHAMTKQLATRFAEVAIEDLNVDGMTRSARGTLAKPGRLVRQKASLNRAILDAAPAELRRQLTYKTGWYGSTLAVLDRWWPSSKTCSACGWQNPRLTLADRTFQCANCTLTIDRDLNAARNIAAHAVPNDQPVAPGRGETQNARGAPVRPSSPRAGRLEAMKREGTSPSRPVPPQRSNPLTLFTLNEIGHEAAMRV